MTLDHLHMKLLDLNDPEKQLGDRDNYLQALLRCLKAPRIFSPIDT